LACREPVRDRERCLEVGERAHEIASE
jgi:hypothetical protein